MGGVNSRPFCSILGQKGLIMEVNLFTTTDDKRVVNKTLTAVKTLSCSVYDNCDIYKPRLLIEYDASIYTTNYMYIPLMQRYYFITDVILDAGNRMVLHGELDVLYTYRNSISQVNATVVRNEFAEDNLLVDPIATFTPQKEVKAFQFPDTPFNAREIGSAKNFVMVIGGGYTSG